MILVKILTFLLLVVIIFAQIEHYSSIGKLIRLRKIFKTISIHYIASSIIWISSGVLTFLVVIDNYFFDIENYKWIGQLLILLISLSVLVLGFVEYKLSEFIHRKWKVITSIAAVSSVVFTMYVNIYVDAEIIKYTQLRASIFPNAQNIIFMILTPFFMIIFSLYIFMVFYFAHAGNILSKQIHQIPYINKLTLNIFYLFSGKKLRDEFKKTNENRALALLIGLMLLILSGAQLLLIITNEKHLNLNKIISDSLIFSSYHLKGYESCSNIKDKTILISFIKNNRISIAKPDSKGSYQFYIGKCKRLEKYNFK